MNNASHILASIDVHTRAARHLLAEKGDRSWTTAEQQFFDAHMDEVERLQTLLPGQQGMASRHAKFAQHREGFELWVRKGFDNLSPAELQKVRNTMSTGVGSQGGYAVESLVAAELVSNLKGYGFMRQVARELTTSSGAPMSIATSDGTAEVGELVGQNNSANQADPSFATRDMTAYKFGSKIFTLPIELIADSQVDIVSEVMLRCADRIGRAENPKFTTGSGSGEPTGLVTAASVGKTGLSGQTATLIYDDLVDLVDSVDDAHIGVPSNGAVRPLRRPGWMFSQATRKVIRKIKDSNGRPIWTPTYHDNVEGGTQGWLLDFPVYINNDMPAPAASAKSVAFGNLASYIIRDVLEMQVFRLADSAYTSKGQIGFLAWARAGGNLADLGAVKLYQHSAT